MSSKHDIMQEVRMCLVRMYELKIGLDYHPQTMKGIEFMANDQREIDELDKRVDQLIDEHPWLKSTRVISNIIENESSELKASLSSWISHIG